MVNVVLVQALIFVGAVGWLIGSGALVQRLIKEQKLGTNRGLQILVIGLSMIVGLVIAGLTVVDFIRLIVSGN